MIKISSIIKQRILKDNSNSKYSDSISKDIFENKLRELDLYDAFKMWLETQDIKDQYNYSQSKTISRSDYLLTQLGLDFGFTTIQLDQLFK